MYCGLSASLMAVEIWENGVAGLSFTWPFAEMV